MNYQVELLDAFESKSHVFHQLIQKYKHSLSSTIDDAFYGGIGLLINTTQNKYRTQSHTSADRIKSYNFYKDSNIPEVYNTTTLLDKIEARVQNELNQWPDHAVLIDVGSFLSRIEKKICNIYVLKKQCYFNDRVFKIIIFHPIIDNNDNWSHSIARYYRANRTFQYGLPNFASKGRRME